MLAAVTRVLNEDDVVEAFVRHTLAFVDRMILLDNGSTDGTLGILRQLQAEGAPVVLLQSRSVLFSQAQHNTLLYHTADQAFRPDWVLCLDADEFIDARDAGLPALLAGVPAEAQSVHLALRNYFAEGLDAGDLLVPRRMRLRDATERGVAKCFLRGGLGPELRLEPGNHAAWFGAEPARAAALTGAALAHYPVRHPVQGIAKAVLSRLKVLAAGGGDALVAQTASHYTPFLDALCRDPAEVLHNAAYMGNALPGFPLVEDPIRYAGAPLRYTTASDPVLKALRAAAHAAEGLARSHGELLDRDPALRRTVEAGALHTEFISL